MQQINILKRLPIVEVKKEYLNDKHLIILIALVWIGFLGLTVKSFWTRSSLESAVLQLETEQKIAQTKLQELTAQYPEAAKVALEQKSKEIEQKIAAKQALVNLLNQATGTNGYSSRLQALSQTITAETWLTSIILDDSTQYVGMAGAGLNSDGIFQFVDRLSQSAAFGEVKFKVFNITGMDKLPYLRFVLSSEIGRLPEKEEEKKTNKRNKRAQDAS